MFRNCAVSQYKIPLVAEAFSSRNDRLGGTRRSGKKVAAPGIGNAGRRTRRMSLVLRYPCVPAPGILQMRGMVQKRDQARLRGRVLLSPDRRRIADTVANYFLQSGDTQQPFSAVTRWLGFAVDGRIAVG